MAKTDLLKAWLNALSDEAKQKQEWRYWMAKTTAQASDKAKQHLEALSKERGFINVGCSQIRSVLQTGNA